MAHYDEITGMYNVIAHMNWLKRCWTKLHDKFGSTPFAAKDTDMFGSQLSRLVAAGICEIVYYEDGEYERYSRYYNTKIKLPYQYAIYALKPFSFVYDTIENTYGKDIARFE